MRIALKVFTLSVKVLQRVVDGDKVPSVDFLNGDLEIAKEEIKAAFVNEQKKYIPNWKIFNKRWNYKHKGPLHSMGTT